uniref:P-selectin glycoprotein ligand 1 n=1 Tax=Chelydra serpentina TaxID=8475 RepID=A0A8C3SXS8_CHESE
MPVPVLRRQPSSSQGSMAPIGATLLLLFSSLLQASAYKLPPTQHSGQDDTVGEIRAAGGIPAAEGSPRGQWVWDTAGAGMPLSAGADFPVFIREKRDAEVKSSNRSAEETTTTDTFSMTPSKHPMDETESSLAPDQRDESMPQENFYDDDTTTAQPLSADSSDNDATEAASVQAASHLDTLTKAAPTQSSSNVSSEAASVKAGSHLDTLTMDETESSLAPDQQDESMPQENFYDDDTTTAQPWSTDSSDNDATEAASVQAGSHLDTLTKAAPTQSSSNVSSEAAAAGIEELLVNSTESREHGSSIRPVGVKGLEESSPTLPPKPLTKSSDGVLPVKELASWRSGLLTVGKTHAPRMGPPAGGSVTTEVPLQQLPFHTNILVGKCLLAIFILALVAATFIVCTAILATLLWRQKRVCQVRQHSHTEMVCISALLPDGEPVANGEKPSKVKRMKMPRDNSSETEGDNLTLSSFLPDH